MWGYKGKPRMSRKGAGSTGHSGYYSLSESMIDDPWDDEDDDDFAERRRDGPSLWDLAWEILTAHGVRYWAVRIAAATAPGCPATRSRIACANAMRQTNSRSVRSSGSAGASNRAGVRV